MLQHNARMIIDEWVRPAFHYPKCAACENNQKENLHPSSPEFSPISMMNLLEWHNKWFISFHAASFGLFACYKSLVFMGELWDVWRPFQWDEESNKIRWRAKYETRHGIEGVSAAFSWLQPREGGAIRRDSWQIGTTSKPIQTFFVYLHLQNRVHRPYVVINQTGVVEVWTNLNKVRFPVW